MIAIAWSSLLLCLAASGEMVEEQAGSPRASARERTVLALESSGFDVASHVDELESIWNSDCSTIEAVALSLAACHEGARALLSSSISPWERGTPLPDVLVDEQIAPFLRANLALRVAQEMVRHNLLDEALTVLSSVSDSDVVDPATFHFLTASCAFHLSKTETALTALENLDGIQDVPMRYQAMADMLRISLEQSDPKSLQSIAQDMRDVRRRLDLGQTDKQVRDIETGVIERLDAMIEEIERQQQDQQQQASNQNQPSGPAQDSKPAGGEGEGQVGQRRFTDRRSWGNLPPKERERAIQDIGRELPGHYRGAVEQYFRRLATTRRGESP